MEPACLENKICKKVGKPEKLRAKELCHLRTWHVEPIRSNNKHGRATPWIGEKDPRIRTKESG